MEISRKSWHYRMTAWCWDHFGKTPSNSLCGYFWQMVSSPFVVIGMYAAILVVVLVMLSWSLYLSGAYLCNFLHWIHVLPDSFDMVPGVINWRHFVVSLLITAGIVAKVVYSVYKQENPNKEPNVVFEFIKAKKRKICPLIEFKD